MLAADNLCVKRGGVSILRGISAEFRLGQMTAICGPNGAGKSTLLAALAELITPDQGGVTLNGGHLAALDPRVRAQAIGYLPQSGEVAWDVSVASLVALGRLPHGDAGEEAIGAALAVCDLSQLTQRPISTLSGGERARALLARVLAGEPQWILADEPLAALDLAHQLALLRTMRKAAEEGAGVVLVLHDLALAMNHADRVLVLHEGQLAADGPPHLALAEEQIARVWGVEARWLGENGHRALAT